MTAVAAAVVATGRLLVDLTLDAHHDSGWLVLTVAGEIDVYSAKQLGDFLAEQQTQQIRRQTPSQENPPAHSRESLTVPGGVTAHHDPAAGVVLDLRGVSFIDSAGLGVLVAAYRRARSAAQPIRLVSTSGQLGMLLSMTRLDTVMPMHEDVAAAIFKSQ